jgi:glycerophosphoryl diester phosphodiesterase
MIRDQFRITAVGLAVAACLMTGGVLLLGNHEEAHRRFVPLLAPRLFDCRASRLALLNPREKPCLARGDCSGPQLSGHRGVGGERGRLAPESTLAAVRAAIALKLDFIEVDPRLTADGVPVVVHDATLDRTTLGRGRVDRITFAALRALGLRSDDYFGCFDCERVPSLREVLQLCRGRIVVLIDAEKTDRVDLIVRAVHEADARDWVVFDAANLEKIGRALALDPQLMVQIRPPSVDQILPQVRQLRHPPVIVELRPRDVRAGAPIVHALGARVLTNVFEADQDAELTGNLTGYEEALHDGADILQGDRPELALRVMHRPARRRPAGRTAAYLF